MRIVNLVEDTPGSPGCGYEHGLSFYVETRKHKLLVDSGATDLFRYNAQTLGIDLKQVDILVLSHGHYDHGGGIAAFTQWNPEASVYMKSGAGAAYYHVKDSGAKYIGIDKNILQLKQCVTVEGDLRIDEELFLFSGLSGEKYPARGNRELKRKEGDNFVQDTFDHEQCVAVAQDGLHVLLSGCAHNGILNILDRYASIFHAMPDIVISGFHLQQKEAYTEADISNIERMAYELLETGALFYTGHCTGGEACGVMKKIMGAKLQVIHSGMRIL